MTANGASAYRFAGNGVVSTADNPDLYLIRGQKYRFINNSGGSHPFQIRVSSGGSAYSTGVTNNGASSGNIDFAPTYDSPAQLVYQCTSHGGMVGNIYIRGASGGEINVGVSTFTGDITIKSSTPLLRLTDTDTSGPLNVDIESVSGDLYLDTGSVHRDVIVSSAGRANEIIRFTGDGKVGVNTTTGDGLINTRHAGTNQQVLHVRADLGSSNNRSINLYTPDTDNASAPFRFQTGNGYLFQCDSEDVFTIAHDRTVGINTQTTQDSAHFQHYTSTVRHQSFQSTNGDLAIVTDNNSNPAVYIKGTGTADLLNVFDNTSEVFTIKDGGKLGINHDTSGASTNAPLTIKNATNSSATRVNLVNSGSSQTESTQIYSQNNDLVLVASANDQVRIAPNVIDYFEEKHTFKRISNTSITDGGSKTFTITGLAYGNATLQIGGYGEGASFSVFVSLGGLMAGGSVYYRHDVLQNSSSSDASVSISANQTSYVVTISNNVGNGGSIHCTGKFEGWGANSHPSLTVS